jgi:hypothetical protein
MYFQYIIVVNIYIVCVVYYSICIFSSMYFYINSKRKSDMKMNEKPKDPGFAPQPDILL